MAKDFNRNTDFFPKLIGEKSDYSKGTGIYHPKNKKLFEKLKKHNMKKTLVLIKDKEYAITCDPTQPCEGLTYHDYAGNRLMDFNSHVGVNILGYNHPKIVEMGGKIAESGVVSFIGAGTDFPIVSDALPDVTNLNELLVKTAKQNGFKKITRAGGWSTGTEAVENCMKIAYDWKKRKLFKKWGNKAEKNWALLEEKLGYPLFGIAADKCFHGRTLGSLSMTHSKEAQYKYFPHIPNIIHIPYLAKGDQRKFTIYEKVNTNVPLEKLLQDGNLEKILADGQIPIDLLAFICLEPIQGEGGYKIPKEGFLQDMVDFCKLNDVVYIDDEVQAGMGRTGKFFALSHYVENPSNVVIAMAKGLHVSAILIEENMNYEEQGRASTTSGYGRLSDIAIGYAKMEAILENNGALMKNATKMGNYFKKEVKKINNGILTRIDGEGLLLVTDFETPEIRNKAFERIVEKGLIPLTVGVKGIRWIPALDVRKQEIDYAVKTIEEVIKTL
ncbi:MAG: aminotransferase class III-fold pyridoxal phosphate-dependent enzyme [Nanoarchaeota archaeon]|nr:aminotransferase class III-fold pyridoxal phosphate-dependent enzyme [Nanoarchaeota archaeon]